LLIQTLNNMNQKTCPFCKGQNKCMAHTKSACWCNGIEIPTSLIDLVPQQLKRESCICLSCIEAYNANPDEFTKNYLT